MKSETKPVVHYMAEDSLTFNNRRRLTVGLWVFISVVDHPKHMPFTFVKTSPIEVIGSLGVFETRNTIYRPL